MTKNTFRNFAVLFLTCTTFLTYADDNNVIKFIKGNISDKITAVKTSSGEESAILSVGAIDFVLSNINITGSEDRDMNTLAVSGVLSLSVPDIAKDIQQQHEILQKLYKLFDVLKDDTIRISIIDKIVQFYAISPSTESVQMLSKFLKKSLTEKQASDIQKSAIIALGKIGNGESFIVLYDCIQDSQFSIFSNELSESLANIADKSLTEILQIINKADVTKIAQIFSIITESEKISPSFKAEIAENVLSEALYIADSNSFQSINQLEFDAFKVIIKYNWSRASTLIMKYFKQSKMDYNNSKIDEKQFIDIINGISLIATAEASVSLSEYLDELNKSAEKGIIPSEKVVLSVIATLGNLGSKTAFDSLLYVTYLDYTENVIAEARKALTKLKW